MQVTTSYEAGERHGEVPGGENRPGHHGDARLGAGRCRDLSAVRAVDPVTRCARRASRVEMPRRQPRLERGLPREAWRRGRSNPGAAGDLVERLELALGSHQRCASALISQSSAGSRSWRHFSPDASIKKPRRRRALPSAASTNFVTRATASRSTRRFGSSRRSAPWSSVALCTPSPAGARLPSPLRTTSSPAWSCSSTSPIPRARYAPCAAPGEAGLARVLFDDQPQPQVLPVRGDRRRVPPQLLPKGTHDYMKFIRPSELARHCRDRRARGARGHRHDYNPFTRTYSLGGDTDVNYLVDCVRR